MSTVEMSGSGRVVVGYDGRWRARGLLDAAAEEAQRQAATLVVVTVRRPPADAPRTAAALLAEDRRAEASARAQLSAAERSLRARFPGLGVETACVTEDDVDAAGGPLAGAALLVVGARGRYGRRALGLESVSRVLLRAARCAVFVVPDDAPPVTDPEAPVLAGVGPHVADAQVIATAVAQARRRRSGLHLVHAVVPFPGESPDATIVRGWADAAAVIAEAAPDELDQLSATVAQEAAVAALTRRAAGASLLVVGSRPGSLAGLVPESVSRALIGAVACPVLVVPRGIRPAAAPLAKASGQ